MKLSDYLKNLIGKEITSENIATISKEIDVIKKSAVEKAVEPLKGKLEIMEPTYKEYVETQKQEQLKKAFVENGGNPDSFDKFKKSFKVDKIDEFNFKEVLDDFPTLKAQEGKDPALFNKPEGNEGNTDDDLSIPAI